MKRFTRYFLNRSVKQKQMIGVMLIAFITAFIICTAFITYDIRSTKQSMVDELLLVSNIIGKRTAPGMQFYGVESQEKAIENLSDIRSKESVILACLYKMDGSVFAYYRQSKDHQACPKKMPRFGSQFAGQYLDVHQEVVALGNKPVGSILLRADMREVHSHLQVFAFGITALMLAVMAIAFVLAHIMQKIIADPVIHLTQTAVAITSHKDYTVRAAKYYEDELGTLADSFNDMLSEVQKRDDALHEANITLEDKVLERTRELEHALKVKDTFLANMNHEIRTPIHSVINFLKILARDWDLLDEQERRNMAQRADTASNRLLLLINNLLDMSKLEEGAMHFDMQPHKVSKLVDQLILETEGLRHAKKMELQFDRIPADQEPDVECDEGRISQVITNLIGNAIKYSPGGTITIKQYMAEVDLPGSSAIVPGLAIAFSDEGVGIPENELTSIFDKFNESSRTKSGAGGTGLGLAICREIILSHIGRIWAENNPSGKGSTFTFLIPLQVPPGVTRQTKDFL